MSKNSLAPRRPCKGRGTACGGRVGGEGHEVARGLLSNRASLLARGLYKKWVCFISKKIKKTGSNLPGLLIFLISYCKNTSLFGDAETTFGSSLRAEANSSEVILSDAMKTNIFPSLFKSEIESNMLTTLAFAECAVISIYFRIAPFFRLSSVNDIPGGVRSIARTSPLAVSSENAGNEKHITAMNNANNFMVIVPLCA